MKQHNKLLKITIASTTLSLTILLAPCFALAEQSSNTVQILNMHSEPIIISIDHLKPTQDQLALIGKRFFKNQKAKENTPQWGEDQEHDFVYIGSLEYIWYGKNNRAGFIEDWTEVASRLQAAGLPIEKWALGACPWNTKEAFEKELAHPEKHDFRLPKLITLLSRDKAQTVQVRTLVDRLNRALEYSHDPNSTPTIFQNLPPGELELLKSNLDAVASVQDAQGYPLGLYALLDCSYFKGEGTAVEEHCNVNGWGLQEILLNMDPNTIQDTDGAIAGPLQAFIDSGLATLDRRIANHQMEADRNNRPVLNESFNPDSDYDKFWNTWENRLRDYGNWPK